MCVCTCTRTHTGGLFQTPHRGSVDLFLALDLTQKPQNEPERGRELSFHRIPRNYFNRYMVGVSVRGCFLLLAPVLSLLSYLSNINLCFLCRQILLSLCQHRVCVCVCHSEVWVCMCISVYMPFAVILFYTCQRSHACHDMFAPCTFSSCMVSSVPFSLALSIRTSSASL